MSKATRTPITTQEAEARYPGAFATFPDKANVGTYTVYWSQAYVRGGGGPIDGIHATKVVEDWGPCAVGFLYYKGTWRKL